GMTRVPPSCSTSSRRSTVPYWNRVTNRVHSPISVGATRRPINALTHVGLPDLIRPATAPCSGLSRLRNTSAQPAAVRLLTCGCNCLHRLATEAESGPCPPEFCTVVVTVLPPAPRCRSCHDRHRPGMVLLGPQRLRDP